MSIFKDKIYEEMDFLSQAVEPFLDPVIDEFAKLPEVIAVPNAVIAKALDSYDTQSTIIDTVIRAMIDRDKFKELALFHLIKNAYTVVVDGDEFEFDIVNPDNNPRRFSIVKNKSHLEDKMVMNAAIDAYLLDLYYSGPARGDNQSLEMCRRVASLMEVNSNSKSCEKLWSEISISVRKHISDGSWKIRSSEAMRQLKRLLVRCVRDNDFSAYATLAKLKIMIHHGQAIYKIEEVA